MTSGAQVAAAGLSHLGHRYVLGGWDCSSMVSHVLSVDLGMSVPGFKPGVYQGPPPHGPVVSDYLRWSGAQTIPGPPVPGDLVCFGPDTHIGIATSATTFVSALNPEQGTRDIPIAGAAPGVLSYRRLLELGGTVPFVAQPGASAGSVLGRLLIVAGLAVAAVAGAAVLLSAAITAATGAAAGTTRAGR